MEEQERDIRICPVCGREVDRINMCATRDCHGIYMRLVCESCWPRVMAKAMTVSIIPNWTSRLRQIIKQTEV